MEFKEEDKVDGVAHKIGKEWRKLCYLCLWQHTSTHHVKGQIAKKKALFSLPVPIVELMQMSPLPYSNGS